MPLLKRDYFKGKRITVFGIGLNGGALGAIEFLIQSGAREVIATDIRSGEELAPTFEKLKKYKEIVYVLGQHRPEDFTHVDLVVKNPGIPWTNEYIKLALEKRIPVETDASIFFQLIRNQTVGVTGTRGKSTTAALIAHILEQSGRSVVRVGVNQTGFLSELGKVGEKSIIVAELSSWRLSSLQRIGWSPHVAVVTNLYSDHQNYYKSMEAYARDKQAILEFQKPTDAAVLNFDQATVRSWVEKTKAPVAYFSRVGQTLSDGLGLVRGDIVEWRDGSQSVIGTLMPGQLLGEHNEANILAALAAVQSLGVPIQETLKSVATFKGLPHRLEPVIEKNGIAYINDTAATSPEALVAALQAFSRPIVLIAGGADKQFDFAALAPIVLERTKGVVLLKGTGTDKLLALLEKEAHIKRIERFFPVVTTMRDAVALAEENAAAGDIILLSPGMASFGLFKNEFDRGEQFRQAVAGSK